MKKRLLISWLLMFSLSASLVAQDPKPQPSPNPRVPQAPQPAPPVPAQSPTPDQDVIRITTNLVQVDVAVTKDGKQVTDLKPEEFELFEDGRRQEITNFSYVVNSRRVGYSSSSGSLAVTPPRPAEGAIAVKPITREQVGRTMAILSLIHI